MKFKQTLVLQKLYFTNSQELPTYSTFRRVHCPSAYSQIGLTLLACLPHSCVTLNISFPGTHYLCIWRPQCSLYVCQCAYLIFGMQPQVGLGRKPAPGRPSAVRTSWRQRNSSILTLTVTSPENLVSWTIFCRFEFACLIVAQCFERLSFKSNLKTVF